MGLGLQPDARLQPRFRGALSATLTVDPGGGGASRSWAYHHVLLPSRLDVVLVCSDARLAAGGCSLSPSLHFPACKPHPNTGLIGLRGDGRRQGPQRGEGVPRSRAPSLPSGLAGVAPLASHPTPAPAGPRSGPPSRSSGRGNRVAAVLTHPSP